VQKAARTGFYDYIGHIDVIKRFGFMSRQDVTALENQTLDVVKQHGLAIELNASGLRMPAKEMFPSRRILEYCFQVGIPLTVGSDAHQPARLGQYLDQATNLLQNIGFTELATFKQRKREMIPFCKPV
jgi:histidinol-phosphatase (PHP family)